MRYFHTVFASWMEFNRNTAPSAAHSRTLYFSINENWWQPTNCALLIRYGAFIGFGPKRKCETVMPPLFLESYTKYAWA